MMDTKKNEALTIELFKAEDGIHKIENAIRELHADRKKLIDIAWRQWRENCPPQMRPKCKPPRACHICWLQWLKDNFPEDE